MRYYLFIPLAYALAPGHSIGMMNTMIRNTVAKVIAPLMTRTGFRFSKDYRHGTTLLHRAVYALCNTVKANMIADGF